MTVVIVAVTVNCRPCVGNLLLCRTLVGPHLPERPGRGGVVQDPRVEEAPDNDNKDNDTSMLIILLYYTILCYMAPLEHDAERGVHEVRPHADPLVVLLL